jgi:hypothetical protein
MTRRFAQYFSLLALLIILLCGCATLTPQVVVTDNTFSSDYPKISVKINPKYRYIGHINYKGETEDYQDPAKKAVRINDIYTFVPKDTKDQMGSAVIIAFTKLANPGWTYVGSVYQSSSKTVYRHGVATFAGQNYEAATHRMIFGSTAQPFYDHLMSQGLLASKGFIVRSYHQIVSSDSTIVIRYIQDISTTGFKPVEWNDKALLKDAQIRFLDDFEKRASDAFEIIKHIK